MSNVGQQNWRSIFESSKSASQSGLSELASKLHAEALEAAKFVYGAECAEQAMRLAEQAEQCEAQGDAAQSSECYKKLLVLVTQRSRELREESL